MPKTLPLSASSANHIAVFQEMTIRRTWHNEEWWFAIVDVLSVLTDSVQPEGYVKALRRRDPELAKRWGQIATPLRIETADWRRWVTHHEYALLPIIFIYVAFKACHSQTG